MPKSKLTVHVYAVETTHTADQNMQAGTSTARKKPITETSYRWEAFNKDGTRIESNNRTELAALASNFSSRYMVGFTESQYNRENSSLDLNFTTTLQIEESYKGQNSRDQKVISRDLSDTEQDAFLRVFREAIAAPPTRPKFAGSPPRPGNSGGLGGGGRT